MSTTHAPLPAHAMHVPAPAADAYRMGEGSEWQNDSAWAEVFEARRMLTGLATFARCNTRLFSCRDADPAALCGADR